MNEKVIKKILQERVKKDETKTFENITKNFDSLFNTFNPTENYFSIEQYFGEGFGKNKAKQKLIDKGIINDSYFSNSKENDFKGLYVFFYGNEPFYVGISKVIIKRIIQHVKGNSHQTSTLAYKIGRIKMEIEENIEYQGKRKDLNKEKYLKPTKEFLMKQNIAFIKIDDDDELALFEIYCSMKLQTSLNTFQTH